MTKDTGGPAFPSKRRVVRDGYITPEFEPVNGMTLRDYFAAKAMQAQLARTVWGVDDAPRDMADEAYGYADAMLKARERA